MKTILSVVAAIITLAGVCKVLSVNESETRVFLVLHEEGNVMLRMGDASLMTEEDIKWIEEASATNAVTGMVLRSCEDATLMSIRQDYNHLGLRCGGHVDFK